MIGKLGRRALDLGVVLFALLGFLYVPLGKRTGLEHLQAIVETGAAREAARELAEAALGLRARMLGFAFDDDANRVRGQHRELPVKPRGRLPNSKSAPSRKPPAADAGAPDASLTWLQS